jgi:hypothetical protein
MRAGCYLGYLRLIFVWRAAAQLRLVDVQIEFSKHAIQKKSVNGLRLAACAARPSITSTDNH